MFLVVLFSLFPINAQAKDCSAVKPFAAQGTLSASITVSKFEWKNGRQTDVDICQRSLKFQDFDVRGREDDAFDCLRPALAEVLVCQTKINGHRSEISVVPASWIRHSKDGDVREYRFHAYVVMRKNTSSFDDLFARTLSQNLEAQSLTLEGALKTGPGNPDDGYFVRIDFKTDGRATPPLSTVPR